jgi:hypothetical protein
MSLLKTDYFSTAKAEMLAQGRATVLTKNIRLGIMKLTVGTNKDGRGRHLGQASIRFD